MKTYDIAVIGAGPAGMTAAIYACRAGRSVALFEKNYPGGQMVSAHEIDNYPSAGKISGFDLAEKMFAQATEAGAEFIGEEVTALKEGSPLVLTTPQGEYRAHAAIIATGTVRSRLNIPGEERLSGRGVSWCATCPYCLLEWMCCFVDCLLCVCKATDNLLNALLNLCKCHWLLSIHELL